MYGLKANFCAVSISSDHAPTVDTLRVSPSPWSSPVQELPLADCGESDTASEAEEILWREESGEVREGEDERGANPQVGIKGSRETRDIKADGISLGYIYI